MKELHNHIFSNTTCISKEIMLKYINNQLSVKELHEVEKHLLDCEFCSEALEGLRYAENSSILFAIDNQIDQRVRMGGAKSTVMRNLMVAASLLIIITGAWFTFDYFEEAVDQQSNLALKELEEPQVEDHTKIEAMLSDESDETSVDRSLNSANSASGEINANQQEHNVEKLEEKVPDMPEVVELAPMEDAEVVAADEIDMVMEEEADEESNQDYYREPITESNKPKSIVNDSFSQTESSKDNAMGGALSGNVLTKTAERKSNDNRTRNKSEKQKSKGSKKRAMSPAYKAEARAEEQFNLADDDALNTITLSSYKVVDYTDEYQEAYDLKNTVESTSVPAGFANEEDKVAAEKEKEELEVEITYRATLEKGMSYFKAEKYSLALEQFNIILKEHPDEVNGLFYGGLSYFHLGRFNDSERELNKVLTNEKTDFNEEASWYKALTLIELKKLDAAKALLNQIVAQKGFYSSKAKAKLNEL